MLLSLPLETYLDELRRLVNSALEHALSDASMPAVVRESMQYAMLGGGKRLRPCVSLAVADAVALNHGGSVADARSNALPHACAVEFVHCYSLVHDDLPAMDDDTLRRGRPTTHVVYGDGMAILAGDGLLTEAFAIIARSSASTPALGLRSIAILATAAGPRGMVGGQAIDLAAAGKVFNRTPPPFERSSLEDMHARKTGALIRAAATMGAVAAGADDPTVAAVDAFARDLGLAFQVVDDVLDVEGSKEELGKTAGKDAAANKATYPALYGLEQSRRLAADCIARAKMALSAANLGGRLADIADWSLHRRT